MESKAGNHFETSFSKKAIERSVRLTRIQKLIGRRMLTAKRTKACYYLEVKVDVTALMKLRPKLRRQLGARITTNAFYVRALAMAVCKYPLVVGTLCGSVIKIAERINVGFAVNAPQGLIVPVIKDAERKSLCEIAMLEKDMTERARSNQLILEDIEGETIALSNLGAYGIDSFLGIVPPPVSTMMAASNVNEMIVPLTL